MVPITGEKLFRREKYEVMRKAYKGSNADRLRKDKIQRETEYQI